MKHYYYLHENGELISKPALAVGNPAEYFESDFVRKWWEIETTDRTDAWLLLLEATGLGAKIDRVKELADRWHCNREDLPQFLVHHPHPTPQEQENLRKFIVAVLGLDPDKVFDEIEAMETEPTPKSLTA